MQNMVNRKEIEQTLKGYLNRIQEIGGIVREFRMDAPATETEILKVEEKIGVSIPCDFRNILLNTSAHLEFYWNIHKENQEVIELPSELREIFAGDIHFGVDLIPIFEESRRDWIKVCFPDYNNDYDKIYYNKLAFFEVGNGDFIAIDLEEKSYGNVVYLSHDGDDMHGYILAHSFTEFFKHWLTLGGVGGESWQLEPFTNNKTTILDSECDNAKIWLELVGF